MEVRAISSSVSLTDAESQKADLGASGAGAFGPGARFLAWIVGGIEILNGLLLLILPAQFAGPAYDSIRPHLSLFGAALIAVGLLLLSWQILRFNQSWLPTVSFLLAAYTLAFPLLGFARTQNWSTASTYAVQAVALLAAAVGVERRLRFRLDLLTALVAIERLLLAFLLLLLPGEWATPAYRFVQPHLSLWGAAFLGVAALLLLRLLIGSRTWSRFLPIPATALMLLWAYETSLRTNDLTGAVTTGMLALGVALEPFIPPEWLGPPKARLRMKLIAGSILFVGVTLLVLVFGILEQTDAAYENRAKRDLSATTQVAADNVGAFVTAQQRAANFISQLPSIRSMDPALATPVLQQVAAADPAVTVAGLSDATGAVVAASTESLPPVAPTQPRGVQRILLTHEAGIEVAQSPRLGVPVLFVRAPIQAPDGTFLGFYSTIVSLATLNSNFGTLPLGEGGRIIIVDEQRRVVVHPDARLVSTRADLSRIAPIAAARQGTLSPRMYRDGNTLWLSAQTTVPGVGWTVLAQRPQNEVLAPADLARERAFGFLLVMLLVATGVLIGFGGALSRPIAELAQAAQQLGKGSFDVPLPAASEDEIGELVRAFDEMREHLRARTLEQERAESALRASEERFRTMVETALEGIWTTNADGQITFANHRAAEMLGYSVAELQGLSILRDLVPERQREIAAAKLARRQQGVAEVMEAPMRRKDGTVIWTQIAASPLMDRSSSTTESVAMFTDITRRKEAAEVRERLLQAEKSARAELAERTAALEAKTAEQDAFLYTVSHDLRAPLVSIQGMAELLSEDAAPRLLEADRFYVTRITENAHHLATLLEDLLTLSRVGRVDTEVESVDIEPLLNSVRQHLAVQLASRDAVLAVDTSLPAVYANAGRLAEVFTNLVDNSVKYTPSDRRPEIHIGACVADGVAEYWIHDNGVGIPADQRERVFGLFARLPDGKRLNANGSGAGLAIVSRIVQVYGGKIWIDDSPDGGSLFRFTLPLTAEPSAMEGSEHGGAIRANSAG